MSGDRTEPLEYASEGRLDAAQWKMQPRFPRVPAIAIALGALLVFHLVFYLGVDARLFRLLWGERVDLYTIVAAFMPVLVQRRDRWSLAVAAGAILGLGVLSQAMYDWPIYWRIKAGGLLALIVLIAAYSWLGHATFQRKGVLRACLLAALAATVIQGIEDFWYAVSGDLMRGFYTRGAESVPWSHMILPYLFLLMLWIGIPWIGRVRKGKPGIGALIIYVSLAAPIVASLAYFGFGRVWLADRSLRTGHPFDTEMSLGILVQHGVSDARLWEVLDHADWNPHLLAEISDWRFELVSYLADHDPSAPARLSAMLPAEPRRVLADAAAKSFVKYGRYEVIPILLRYALACDDWKCGDALNAMGVRQAAWPMVLNFINSMGEIGEVNPRLESPEHARLVALLGSDAGENPMDWFDLLGTKAKGPTAGVPAAITEEADEVLGIFDQYWKARLDLRKRRDRRAGELAAEAHLAAEYERFRELQKKYPWMSVDDLTEGNRALFQLIVQAINEVQVREPDWDAVGTAGLRKEVAGYEERVGRMGGAATAP